RGSVGRCPLLQCQPRQEALPPLGRCGMTVRPAAPNELWLAVDLAAQRVQLRAGHAVLVEYPVSTAVNGPGEQEGSGCTPRGWHVIRAKIGAGTPLGGVFVGRRWTGEIYNAELGRRYPNRDWILTRILWLSG